MSATINPYITFLDKCEEAFTLYKSVFKTEYETFTRFEDMPPNPEYPISEEDKKKVMHVELPISKETKLMGSDTISQFANTITEGNNITISINCESEEETERIFNELSEGGFIKAPLEKTFWNAYFGMFTDRFGIHWMVNCDLKE